jgi:hypothetical protein
VQPSRKQKRETTSKHVISSGSKIGQQSHNNAFNHELALRPTQARGVDVHANAEQSPAMRRQEKITGREDPACHLVANLVQGIRQVIQVGAIRCLHQLRHVLEGDVRRGMSGHQLE